MASSDIQPILDKQPPDLGPHVRVTEPDGRPTSFALDRDAYLSNWFRTNIIKTDQRIDSVKAVADGASAAVTTETNARIAADGALAEQITTVEASLNQSFANGEIYFAAVATPAGATAAYGIYLRAGNVFTGLVMVAKSDGTSAIAFYANQMAMIDSGTLQSVFNYVGGKFYFNVPVVVQTIDIAQQAVTVPSVAVTSGVGSGDTGGAWVTLLTATVTGGSGYALILSTDFQYLATGGGLPGPITGSWRILKDGGSVMRSGGLGVYADYNPAFVTFLDVNIPGTHTYQFQIYVSTSAGKAFQFQTITMLCDLRKR